MLGLKTHADAYQGHAWSLYQERRPIATGAHRQSLDIDYAHNEYGDQNASN